MNRRGAKTADRPLWVLFLLAAAVVFWAAKIWQTVEVFTRSSAGLVFLDQDAGFGAVVAAPVTPEAVQELRSIGQYVRLVSFNGTEVSELPPGRPRSVTVNESTRHAPGQSNTFVVEDRDGRTHTLELPTGRGTSKAAFIMLGAKFLFLGGVYLFIGAFVWWSRPKDPASLPLLLFGLIGAFSLGPGLPRTMPSYALAVLSTSLTPFYGPFGVWLALRFTGHPKSRFWDRSILFGTVASAVFAAIHAVGLHGTSCGHPMAFWHQSASICIALHLTAATLAIGAISWRMSRPPHAPALRRRARLFGLAAVGSFLFPSVSPILFDNTNWSIGLGLLSLACLAVFPSAIGYAIVRHQWFDIRIAVRRSLVFVILSALVSIVYVVLVLGVFQVVGARAQSPVAMFASMAITVLTFTFLQVRVQGFVDRTVFRSRYVYAEAVRSASDAIARAHSVEDVAGAARAALIDALEIRRAYVAFRETPEDPSLEIITLGEPGEAPLPERVAVSQRPIGEVIESRVGVTADDPQIALEPESPAAVFLRVHDLEAIVPIGSIGVLIIGPKRDGRPLDREDSRLVDTVANQLSVGIENALAFAEICALKEGLEEQVEERTRELRAAEGQIVESEKSAMLGRLVAGIVHEINTPLGVLISSSDTMERSVSRLESASPEKTRRVIEATAELAKTQSRAAHRISTVLSSLKQFVSLDRAEEQLFDVRAGLDSAVSLLEGGAQGRVEIKREYPETVHPVRCAPDRLNQVFLHVLQNAINAIEGNGRVSIGVAQRNGSVEIEVKDDGRGIPEEMLPRLFDFGFTKKNGRVGLKLGLPISKQTVSALGGDIRVDSRPGHGTTVKITLPAGVR